MNPFDDVHGGMAAEKVATVTPEMTVGHVVPGMPAAYGTPTMIQHMEMAAGSAIQSSLPTGYVSVGMTVNIRHFAATPVGRTVRAAARATKIEDQVPRVRDRGMGWRPQDRQRQPPAASSMSQSSKSGSA